MTVTARVCERIVASAADDLASETVAAGKRAILDGFAVAVAGISQDGPRILSDYVRELGGNPQAGVFGSGFKTSTVQAAFVNGTAMHVLDYEPMWNPPTHVTSTTLPAAAALAEERGANGRELVTAFVKGAETQGRILLAAAQFTPGDHQFHPPGSAGVMAAAVAASHLLGLDASQLQNALGIAASRAGGLVANIGTMTKATHCGASASHGLECALLAQRGFTGNKDVFEGGYGKTFFPHGMQFDALLAYGDEPYRLVEPGLAIKLFPSQYGTHFAITAALDARSKIGSEPIESIEIRTPVMPYVDRPRPETGLDGKTSFQYTSAAALLDGEVTIDTFSDARRFRPDMEELLGKISLVQDPEIPKTFATMRIETTVKLAGGRTVETVCHKPRGAWGGPPLDRADHLKKVERCFATRLDARATARAIELCESLERLEARELGELWTILRGATAS